MMNSSFVGAGAGAGGGASFFSSSSPQAAAAANSFVQQQMMLPQTDGFALTDEDGFVLSRSGEMNEMQSVLGATILTHANRFNRLLGLKSAKQMMEERRRKIAELNRQLALERVGDYDDDDESDEDTDSDDDNDDENQRQNKKRKKNQQQSQREFDDELLKKSREREKQIIEETTPVPFQVTNITIETDNGSAYFIQKSAPGLIMTRKFANISQTGLTFGNGSFAMVDNMTDTASFASGYSSHMNRSVAGSPSSPVNNNNKRRGIGWIKWPLGGK